MSCILLCLGDFQSQAVLQLQDNNRVIFISSEKRIRKKKRRFGLWAENQSEAATFCSQFVLMNYSYGPLVCWQSSSLAVLSEERGSPLLSLPNVMHRPLPIVADILLSVLSTVK